MKVLKEILVVILSIVSFISLVTYLFLFSTQNILSKKNITNLIEHVEIKEVVGEESITELNKALKESGLPENFAEDILNNKEFKGIVGEYASDVFSSILFSDEAVTIDANDFASDMNEIVDIVAKEAKNNGVKIDEKDLKKAHEEINKNGEQIVSEVNRMIVEAKESIEKDPENQDLAVVLSTTKNTYNNKNIYLIISIVCIVLSILLKIKNFAFISYLRNIGITFGILLALIGLSFNGIIDFIKASIDENIDMIEMAIKTIPDTFLVTGGCFIIVGIICLVGYIFIKKNDNKKVESENVTN